MADASKIRVLVVDDHPVVRMGLRAMVDAERDMHVVAEATTGTEALAAYEAHLPDLVLLDLRLPDIGGAQVISALRARHPDARVLVLTTYDTDEDVFRAIEAGARGYLLKGTFQSGLLETIRCIHAGQRVIPEEVAARLAGRVGGPSLTPREVEILSLVARGLSNKEIGAAMFLAEPTIRNRLQVIYEKLGAKDRAEATFLAVQRGYLKAD